MTEELDNNTILWNEFMGHAALEKGFEFLGNTIESELHGNYKWALFAIVTSSMLNSMFLFPSDNDINNPFKH